MYGQSNDLKEAQQNLHTLDDMVTTAKHALRSIVEAVDVGGDLGDAVYTATKALAEIESKGK